ncbi:MAG: sle, partial [Streptosporangiaceae bacterium]|nr:sle [Streptosporangiaceae bacterium]
PGTFTFAPKVKHIVSYTYSFNWGQTVTVNADDHGVAQLSWTPDQSGFYDLEVYATTRDGLELTPYDYFFSVN